MWARKYFALCIKQGCCLRSKNAPNWFIYLLIFYRSICWSMCNESNSKCSLALLWFFEGKKLFWIYSWWTTLFFPFYSVLLLISGLVLGSVLPFAHPNLDNVLYQVFEGTDTISTEMYLLLPSSGKKNIEPEKSWMPSFYSHFYDEIKRLFFSHFLFFAPDYCSFRDISTHMDLQNYICHFFVVIFYVFA